MDMEKLKDTIAISLKNCDKFYEDIATLLSHIRNELISTYNYETVRDSRIVWEGSSSIDHPKKWSPVYLSYYIKKCNSDDEFCAFSVILKDYFGTFQPLDDIDLIIGKYFHVTTDKNLYWLNKDIIYGDWVKNSWSYKKNENGLVTVELDEENENKWGFKKALLNKTNIFDWQNVENKLKEILSLFSV